MRIDGATPAQDRGVAVRFFREDPGCRVALLSVTAAGTGLDFSAASAVVFAEVLLLLPAVAFCAQPALPAPPQQRFSPALALQ